MYEVTVKKSFEATHALRNYRGGEEAPHAHRFTCEVQIASMVLDAAGCAVDFCEVDAALERALGPLAGASINAAEPFARVSPSAENIARHLYREMARALATGTRRVARVTVWEDAEHSASYSE